MLFQIYELCGDREEPVLAVSMLKGIDPPNERNNLSPSPLIIDWNNAALVFTFCEVDDFAQFLALIPLSQDEYRLDRSNGLLSTTLPASLLLEPEFFLFSQLKRDPVEVSPQLLLCFDCLQLQRRISTIPPTVASLGVMMGIEGPDFKGLNQLQMVSEYFSPSGAAPFKEGRERYTLTISQLQCRGIIASHHFRLGRSLVFVVGRHLRCPFDRIHSE